MNFYKFFSTFVGHFCPPDPLTRLNPDPIRIRNPDSPTQNAAGSSISVDELDIYCMVLLRVFSALVVSVLPLNSSEDSFRFIYFFTLQEELEEYDVLDQADIGKFSRFCIVSKRQSYRRASGSVEKKLLKNHGPTNIPLVLSKF
jgi:hypothetical protein